MTPPFDLEVILNATLDAINADDAHWHPLSWWEPPEPEDLERDRFPGIHPSDLQIGCNRALVYATVNAKRQRGGTLTRKDRRCFDGGHAIHAVAQGYLLKAQEFGFLDYVEPEAPVGPKDNIVGSADALIRVGGVSAGVEIKTAGPSTFWGTKDLTKATDKITTPLAAHRRQTTAYMLGMGVRWFFFVYWDKATDQWSVIPYEMDDAIANDIRKEAAFGLQAADQGILPGQIENPNTCKRCPFAHVCFTPHTVRDVDRR